MQVKLATYAAALNGVSLFVIPETEAERALLRGFWKHGKMETCNGTMDNSGMGFCISWRLQNEEDASATVESGS